MTQLLFRLRTDGEHAALRATMQRRVVHLLRLRRRTHEHTGRRRTRDVAHAVRTRPQRTREPHDAIVAHLAILPRTPPTLIPTAVHPRIAVAPARIGLARRKRLARRIRRERT